MGQVFSKAYQQFGQYFRKRVFEIFAYYLISELKNNFLRKLFQDIIRHHIENATASMLSGNFIE